MPGKDQRELPIGFLDSGVGGIAVLKAAIADLTAEDFIFYGDIGNAPYGSRSDGEIHTIVMNAVDFLVNRGIKALVVACNTASSAAIEDVRARYEPQMPVLGMEPAIKPAVQAHPGGRVAVMATPAALRMRRFHNHLEQLNGAAEILSAPCPGLSRLIEEAGPNSRAVKDYLRELFHTLGPGKLDAVVVGCTHYIFVEQHIRALTGAATYNGVEGTVRHLRRRLEEADLLRPDGHVGEAHLFATKGSEDQLALFERFLHG
jgi:glutamate racemase